jgi:protein phosphatase
MGHQGSGSSRGGGEGFHNEDAFLVEEGLGLYVVCDGASTTPAGEVASRFAVEALEEFIAAADEDLDLRGGQAARAVVEHALAYAVNSLAEAGRSHRELAGLSTTVTLLLAHGDLGVIGHRGDSRAYLIRREKAHQLTIDHELTEAPSNGADHDDEFDVFSLDLKPGDTIVLCTDGAEQVVMDPAIVRVAGDISPRLLASRIVSAAHRVDASLDATAVVVRVRDVVDPGWLELSIPQSGTAHGRTIELA